MKTPSHTLNFTLTDKFRGPICLRHCCVSSFWILHFKAGMSVLLMGPYAALSQAIHVVEIQIKKCLFCRCIDTAPHRTEHHHTYSMVPNGFTPLNIYILTVYIYIYTYNWSYLKHSRWPTNLCIMTDNRFGVKKISDWTQQIEIILHSRIYEISSIAGGHILTQRVLEQRHLTCRWGMSEPSQNRLL